MYQLRHHLSVRSVRCNRNNRLGNCYPAVELKDCEPVWPSRGGKAARLAVQVPSSRTPVRFQFRFSFLFRSDSLMDTDFYITIRQTGITGRNSDRHVTTRSYKCNTHRYHSTQHRYHCSVGWYQCLTGITIIHRLRYH